MLTWMTEEDWATVLELFRACRSRRGAKGRNDRIFLETLHDFAVHNITWRALPARDLRRKRRGMSPKEIQSGSSGSPFGFLGNGDAVWLRVRGFGRAA